MERRVCKLLFFLAVIVSFASVKNGSARLAPPVQQHHPTDSLTKVADRAVSERVSGIPCDVLNIKKLEPQWYSVTLQVNEWWGQCTNDSIR
jgi:hypothetical protein